MSNFEFVIPVSKEDLLKKTNVKDYAVEEVLPARRLPFQLKSNALLFNYAYTFNFTQNYWFYKVQRMNSKRRNTR